MASDETPETDYPLHTLLKHLVTTKYQQYLRILAEYCRPLGTTDATFNDFNKPQVDTSSFTYDELPTILRLVKHYLGVVPIQLTKWIRSIQACL